MARAVLKALVPHRRIVMTKPSYPVATGLQAVRQTPSTSERTRIDTRVGQSPLLMQLAQQARQSQQVLARLRPLLPAPLREAVQAGPLEGDQWCAIVPNSAVAAKMRQLIPTLLAALAEPDEAAQTPQVPLPVITRIRLRVARGDY